MNSDKTKILLLWIAYFILLTIFLEAGWFTEYIAMIIMLPVIFITYMITRRTGKA